MDAGDPDAPPDPTVHGTILELLPFINQFAHLAGSVRDGGGAA